MQRESMTYDVVVVGAGPAGLAAAIRLRRLAAAAAREVSVCVVEKGSEVGAHILSGNVFDPRALDALLPDWRDRGAPMGVPAAGDRLLLLGEGRARPLPVPAAMRNPGCHVISLGRLVRWLGEQAEAAGVDLFPGFAATELLTEDGRVAGIATGDMGRQRDGSPGPAFEPGVELRARFTLLAEGCRGSLSRQAITRFDLDRDAAPQTYGLGIKELWEVPAAGHRPGLVVHTVGWPLDRRTYGGGFLYHQEDNKVAVGLVVGLDYANPHLDPYEEMQRLKTHPAIRPHLQDGRRLAYGARALAEGGWQALPRLAFPGGALIGDAAGTLDVPRIKGAHTAMESGMLAAEEAFANLDDGDLAGLDKALRRGRTGRDLYRGRNIRPGFRAGLWAGLAHAALDSYVLRGRAPWTLNHCADHDSLRPAAECSPIAYPKPDGRLTFDRLTSLALSNTGHREDQPGHLLLQDPEIPETVNLLLYAGPEQRYCPAGVYEFVEQDGRPRLRINAANCVHCKTCDIKDPRQNITWVPPEGGGGPNYPDM